MSRKKVVVGMSGGVDSSVAAYILKEQGYEVIGITMQIWQDEPLEEKENKGGCCGLSAVDDARRVSEKLDIPYYVLNFKKDFKKNVIDYFIDEYIKGRTPNPCIACNRYVKWESMLQKAMELGADYIATGHYAKITRHPVTNRFTLEKSVTEEKDQTYALYNLTQYQLEKTLMPVGDYTKQQVREMAEKIGLSVAHKRDSQEICFVPDGDYGRFIVENSEINYFPGNFIDVDGNVLGQHKGVIYYTIGQRKGLGIAFGKPMFVKKINMATNEITLSTDEQLFSDYLAADHMNFMYRDTIQNRTKTTAKIRYAHKAVDCEIEYDEKNNNMKCYFDVPQRAITPGQAVVFYDDGYVLGGGTIL